MHEKSQQRKLESSCLTPSGLYSMKEETNESRWPNSQASRVFKAVPVVVKPRIFSKMGCNLLSTPRYTQESEPQTKLSSEDHTAVRTLHGKRGDISVPLSARYATFVLHNKWARTALRPKSIFSRHHRHRDTKGTASIPLERNPLI